MTEILETPESRVGEPEQLIFDGLLPSIDTIPTQSVGERFLQAWKKSRRCVGGVALAGTLGFGIGAVVSPFVIPNEVVVGTNNSQVNATLDGTLTIDLGPGDYLQRPSHLPLGAGAHITIQGLHDTDTNEEEINLINQNPQAIASLWGDSAKNEAAVQDALIGQSVEGGALLALIFGTIYGLGYAGLGVEIRRQLSERILEHKAPFVRAALVGGLVVTTSVSALGWINSNNRQAHADSDFNGTALEGWTVKSQPLKAGITELLGYVERNDKFYDALTKELRKNAKQTPLLTSDENYDVIVAAGSYHCNTGVMSLTDELLEQSRAKQFITTGDTTFSGTAPENTCISSLGFHTKTTQRVWVGGNHDSDSTEQAAKDNGFAILNGKVVEIDGRLYAGDDSPRRSAFGQAITQERPETETEMGNRLADKVCYTKKRLFALVVNEPHAAQDTASRGCASLVFAGGSERHTEETTNAFGQKTWYFTLPSVTGAQADSLTFGPLQDVGELTLIKIDKTTKLPIAEQAVRLYPDISVEISEPNFYDVPPFASILTQ